MTATRWVQTLFMLGVLFILGGAWLLLPAIATLGVALIVPMPVLAFIQIRNP